MNFNEVIENIIPLVNDGDKSTPFIISRQNNEWVVNYPYPAEKAQEFFNNIKKIDPFAVMMTGDELAKGSFPYVYDRILTERLNAEYDNTIFINTDLDELNALINLVEENISEFTHEETDYLTTLDKPLAALYEMNSISLVSDNSDYDYDYDKIGDFFSIVGNEIEKRINNLKKPEISNNTAQCDEPKKRNIQGYEEKISIEFAGKYVVLAENQTYPKPYLICNIKYDNPLNWEERYNGVVTDNYIEAMREFISRIGGLVNELETERRKSGLPFQTLTAAEYCIPNSNNADYEDKLILIKPDRLAPEYRSAEHQLVFCTGGNGARAESLGTKVYVKELYSGHECYYRRERVAGLADLTKIPEWALKKLSVLQEIKETPEAFKFGGYHFVPYRQYGKSEIMEDKTVTESTERSMSSDFELGMSKYNWKKNGIDYSYEKFYAASCNNSADIFKCIENGKLYVPHENELMQYNEPLQNKQNEKIESPESKNTAETEPPQAVNEETSSMGGYITVYITNNKPHNDEEHKGALLSLPANSVMLNEALKSIDLKDGVYSVIKPNAVKNEINRLLPSVSGLDELNMLAYKLRDLDNYEHRKLEAVLKSGVAEINSVAGLINLLEKQNFDAFDTLGIFNLEDLGNYWAVMPLNKIPKGMDYAEYGSIRQSEDNGVFTDTCYVYRKYVPETIYNGIVPEEYSISQSINGKEAIFQQKTIINVKSNEKKQSDNQKINIKSETKKFTFQEKLDNAKQKVAQESVNKKNNEKKQSRKRNEIE